MEVSEARGRETSWETVEMMMTLAKLVQWEWRDVDSSKKVELTYVMNN